MERMIGDSWTFATGEVGAGRTSVGSAFYKGRRQRHERINSN
jgi:hypothetical protein